MVEKTQNTSEAKEDTVAPLDLRSLFVAGVHFGHPTKRWNPKMSKYIYGKRSSAHIIDLIQTIDSIKEAKSFMPEFYSQLMKVAKTGVVSKKTASRKISRITKKINNSKKK